MSRCRSCGAPLTRSFVDLGATPLANAYLTAEGRGGAEPHVPLHVMVCEDCCLVQLDHTVPPEAMFSDYAYFSSFSSSWIEHGRRFAEAMTARLNLGADNLVVEIASNDGYLLKHFTERGIPVLGIEPAANVAAAAIAQGVNTEICFFGLEAGRRLAAAGHKADLLIGNNVLAHVPDINDFVAGLAQMLKPEGLISIEFPHLVPFMEKVEFDTIYHEHVFYFSLLAVEKVFARHGLFLFDAEELPTHGGSLRILAVHVERGLAEGQGKRAILAKERALGLDRPEAYDGFAPKVAHCRNSLTAFLAQAKAEGRRVVAYGAAAKGNTLLNVCGVTKDDIAFVADRNPHKQGHYLPGSHIPVVAPETVFAEKPDYLLILPWNLKDEIMVQMAGIREWGGAFVTPVPEVRIFP